MTNETRHWAEDDYWIKATEALYRFNESGQTTITLNMEAIREVIYNGDGPAYRLMDGMVSVQEHEGMDGCRGAPRLLLATLIELANLSTHKPGI